MKRRGFTVLELLVAIAIINIVAALFLSSLRSSREKARFATCINNQRNLTGSLIMYAMDNGSFPNDLTAWLNHEGKTYYAQNTSSFWQIPDKVYATPVSIQPYFDGMLYEFKCPESKYSDNYQGVDYGMNQIIKDMPYSSINIPEKIIVTTDAFNSYSLAYPDDIDFRHRGGALAGFVDGHVDWVKPGNLFQYDDGGVGYALSINDIDSNFNSVPDYLEAAPGPDTSGNGGTPGSSGGTYSQTGSDGSDNGSNNLGNQGNSDENDNGNNGNDDNTSNGNENDGSNDNADDGSNENDFSSGDQNNNGHGNNEDGVDISNPGDAPFADNDTSAPIDDEGQGGGAAPSQDNDSSTSDSDPSSDSDSSSDPSPDSDVEDSWDAGNDDVSIPDDTDDTTDDGNDNNGNGNSNNNSNGNGNSENGTDNNENNNGNDNSNNGNDNGNGGKK